jgi:hypothetical protein
MASSPIWGPRPDSHYCQTVAGLLMWGTLSEERTGLSFTIAAGPRQSSHSRIRVPWDSWPYFTVSDSRLPQCGGSGPRMYIPQGTGWPSYTLRHRVPFSSPPTTRRAKVEVVVPASTQAMLTALLSISGCLLLLSLFQLSAVMLQYWINSRGRPTRCGTSFWGCVRNVGPRTWQVQ